jgi:hypothetical protein
MKVTIYWPDYTMTKAANATAALKIIAEKQWEEQVSVERMKELLAGRAWGWCNAVVDPSLPDEEFLSALGDTGMVFVWFGEEDPWRGVGEGGLA